MKPSEPFNRDWWFDKIIIGICIAVLLMLAYC